MQYSPYSPNLNPYQTIYNNGGAAAYNPQWGYGDAFAHAIGYRSNLPLGYTRQQYNEERALAAESMWKSPLLGLGSFAVGTASIYAIWGSPLEGLAAQEYQIPGISTIEWWIAAFSILLLTAADYFASRRKTVFPALMLKSWGDYSRAIFLAVITVVILIFGKYGSGEAIRAFVYQSF